VRRIDPGAQARVEAQLHDLAQERPVPGQEQVGGCGVARLDSLQQALGVRRIRCAFGHGTASKALPPESGKNRQAREEKDWMPGAPREYRRVYRAGGLGATLFARLCGAPGAVAANPMSNPDSS